MKAAISLPIIGPIRCGVALAAAAVLVQPLAIFAYRGIAVLFTFLCVVSAIAAIRSRLDIRRLATTPVFFLFAALIWAAVSTPWSMNPSATLEQAGRLLLGILGGLSIILVAGSLDRKDRSLVANCLLVGQLLGLALLTEERVSDNFLGHLYNPTFAGFSLNHAATTLALGFWPIAAILWSEGRRRSAIILALVTVIVLGTTDSLSASVGLAPGAIVFFAVLYRPRLAMTGLGIIVAMMLLVAPLLPKSLPDGGELLKGETPIGYVFGPRLFIWQNTVDKIVERPVAGWGLGTSRFFYNSEDQIRIGGSMMEPIPLHPHNAILQWWLEIGGIGTALVGGALITLILALSRWEIGIWKATAAATLTTTLMIASVSYGIWQAWWVGAYWMYVAFLAALMSSHSKPAKPADAAIA